MSASHKINCTKSKQLVYTAVIGEGKEDMFVGHYGHRNARGENSWSFANVDRCT